jgi:pentose-5-phosphate-3-epimerase
MINEPKRTGKKAVVFMKADLLVEVEASEDYYDMVEQAEAKIKRHVVEGAGFFPFRCSIDMVQDDVTVADLIRSLTIQPGTGWNR